jgi:hypothetical protein
MQSFDSGDLQPKKFTDLIATRQAHESKKIRRKFPKWFWLAALLYVVNYIVTHATNIHKSTPSKISTIFCPCT